MLDQEQQQTGGQAGVAAAVVASAAGQPYTPGPQAATRQLQNVLGSNGPQPDSAPAKMQRVA